MASFLRKIFGLRRKKLTKKDSITGRNNSFPVPYLSKLEGNQLESGQSLIVRGIIISNDEFVINLTSGSRVILDEETHVLDDRLLCMKVELQKKRIRLNACINGEWGSEGFVKHKWKNGDEFDIRIRCHEDEFEIFVEHKLCARFGHYVPLTKISHLYVDGCVELYSVSWEGREYIVPYAADIPGNFYPGRRLYISGLIKKRAKHFQLILYSGNNIALRMTTKFGFSKIFKMSIIIEPHISNKRNRLRAFNEDESNGLNQNFRETEKKDVDISVKTTLPSNLEENPKKDIFSSKEDISSHKENKRITSTKSNEMDNNNNKQKENEGKLIVSDGKKKNGKSFSTRISTMWEDVKRMMGFSPDCLNGGYRSIGSRSCTCPQYFEGQLCEQIICANGGTRLKEKTTGFGGIQTEEDICKCTHPIYITGRHCEQVNCQNGGRLLSDGNCQCVDGWYSGNFCQYYTSSWLVAIGIPLIFMALVIFCCVVCRMDLCSLCRQRPSLNTQRARSNDRRPRRRQHQQTCPSSFGDCRGQQPRNGQNRVRRSNDNSSNATRRQQQHDEHFLYSQQNILNAQQQEQQYILRLERFPMLYNNPNCIIDKPLDPPPPYEQAILCLPTPFGIPPNYCNFLTQQSTNISINQNNQQENIERNENINQMDENILEEREDENIQEENNQQTIQQPTTPK
ncbi:EGF-like domain-containing protein [Meloidogyne graminicola]|uniref:EGF-like domain-containing protein n=1 Tax=Meloidogyne graminicola TaxID=189291 RepID=A0A8T0A296_9BILA|nr:EGF-like domain-containing protein [Meloidogyne graminicola]